MKSVYREAAERIASGKDKFTCKAIEHSLNFRAGDKYKFKKLFFEKDEVFLQNYWWGTILTPESQLARSIALLLMAEIEEGK